MLLCYFCAKWLKMPVFTAFSRVFVTKLVTAAASKVSSRDISITNIPIVLDERESKLRLALFFCLICISKNNKSELDEKENKLKAIEELLKR